MERLTRRRRRPALSCVECRRRKIKCDRTDPCAHCVDGRVQCVYRIFKDNGSNSRVTEQHQQPLQSGSWDTATLSPSPHISQQSAHETPQSRSIVERNNQTSGPQIATSSEHATITPNTTGRDGVQPVQKPAADTEPTLRDLLLRVQRLESSASTPKDSSVAFNKTRILRWSHWTGAAQQFSSILDIYSEAIRNSSGTSNQDEETKAMVAQTRDLLKKCKNMARDIKMGRPSRCLPSPNVGLSLPSRELADKMAKKYFQSFETTHRILHAPTFWAEYQRYCNHPESVPTGLRLKILLVIGLGSSLEPEGTDAAFRSMVEQWIYAAQTWLSGPLEKDRLDIDGIQIYCLNITARQIFSVGGDLIWMSMGSLIHRAMQIGLHRDPKYLPPMSVLQAELRRRLWATIVEMTVQSSLDSSMPPRISFDEFDTEPPSNVNDDEMDDSTMSLQSHPKGTYTETSLQLALLESLPTRLRIVRLLNGLHSELCYPDVLALSSELSDACRASSSFTRENSTITPFQRNLLDYSIRRFMIPLHCPFASQARNNPLFHYSLKASVDAGMAIISPSPDADFARLLAVGGGWLRESIRSATAAISLELIALVERQHLDGTLQRDTQYRGVLKQAVRHMISLSAERIRQGETNVKSHMFLSMILAHVEAMEAGAKREFEIARSARDSLEFGLGVLCVRVANNPPPSPSDMGSGARATSVNGNGSWPDEFGLDLDLGLDGDWGLSFFVD